MKQYLTLNGLGGYLVAVVGLVVVAVLLGWWAIATQRAESTNYYTVDTNINSIKSHDSNNAQYYKLIKDQK